MFAAQSQSGKSICTERVQLTSLQQIEGDPYSQTPLTLRTAAPGLIAPPLASPCNVSAGVADMQLVRLDSGCMKRKRAQHGHGQQQCYSTHVRTKPLTWDSGRRGHRKKLKSGCQLQRGEGISGACVKYPLTIRPHVSCWKERVTPTGISSGSKMRPPLCHACSTAAVPLVQCKAGGVSSVESLKGFSLKIRAK